MIVSYQTSRWIVEPTLLFCLFGVVVKSINALSLPTWAVHVSSVVEWFLSLLPWFNWFNSHLRKVLNFWSIVMRDSSFCCGFLEFLISVQKERVMSHVKVSHGKWLTLEESFVESKKQICLCKNIDMQKKKEYWYANCLVYFWFIWD